MIGKMASPQPPASILVALPRQTEISAETAAEVAGLCGADSYRLRLLLKASSLTVLWHGEPSRVEAAALSLREKGVRCAAVSAQELGALPRLRTAGGIVREGESVRLRVHGRPEGPPPGAPLLLVFADLARPPSAPLSPRTRPAAAFSQRVLRAGLPVVDVVWDGGRIRVPVRGIAWNGLPGRTLSAPRNFIRLVEALVRGSGGAVLDLGFQGQQLDAAAPGAEEPVEDADRERTALFDRYGAVAAAAWAGGLFPPAEPGKLVLAGEALPGEPKEPLSAPAPAGAAASPIPWIRRAGRSRTPAAVWPWLAGALFFAILFSGSGVGRATAAAGLAVCGFSSVGLGLAALARRERVRSLPQVPVRSMALGPVELSGRAVACAPFLSPFSRFPCGWYRFELQERQEDARGRGFFWTTESGSSGDAPFWLDDGTGRVLVQPAGAQVDVEPQEGPLGAALRAVEWVLAEGETVFVAGFAQRRSTDQADPPAPSAAGSPERDDVFVGSAPGQPFLISRRSRREETSKQTREFLFGAILGGVCLVAALLILLRGSS